VAVEQQSALSDALLRELIAVGQVDVLVGLPTLNNAATVADVVGAVNVCFTRDLPRLRTVMINSDGGSTDGTPDLIRQSMTAEGDRVLTSHALRTRHRVVAPYHGLAGKYLALRTVFAAAELTQAKVLVVLDPAGPATSPDRITELVWPITRNEVEFLAPRHARHPRDGLLVTQLARPLVQALYGVGLDEPLGPEFACSGRFASHCVDKPIWDREIARFAIDLWLRTEAVAGGFAVGQIWRPLSAAPGPRARLREAVQQVMLALMESLASHDAYWLAQAGVRALPSWGADSGPVPDAVAWDAVALADQARQDLLDLEPLLQSVLDQNLHAVLRNALNTAEPRLDDDHWAAAVYAFAAASLRGQAALEHLAYLFVPLYLWRAASFMVQTAHDPPATVQERLEALCATFRRLKPLLVEHWKGDVRST
jgi:hypothetical protein